MKNVTKTNVLFTTTVLVYIILVYTVRLLPQKMMTVNLLIVLPEIILLIPSLFYIMFLRPKTVSDVRAGSVSIGTLVKTVVLTFLMLPLVSLINAVSSSFVGNSVDSTLDVIGSRYPVWLNLVIIALLPAVVEEFIFRGLIFSGYKKRNPLRAVILSAALFGLIHMNINQFSYAFVIGTVFALLVYATGSLVPAILSHFLINGTSVVLSHILASVQTDEMAQAVETVAANQSGQLTATYVVLGIMAVIGTYLAALVFKSICNDNRGYDNVKMIFKKPLVDTYDEAEGKFMDGYLLLGVGICIIYIILYEIVL